MASSAMLTTTATLTATSLVAVTETSKTPPLTTTTTTTTTAAASVGKPSVVTAGAATERPTATSASMLEHDDDDDDCKDDDILNTSLRCCANDPDFAVICAFLQKFAKELGLELPNFKRLQEWLTNTDEVADPIRDLHIKLLRKTRKTVHEKSWESAISKFCFTYSAQDGWELERFGYKQASLKVKLRLLRELLESQFERNNKFRNKILTLSADSLRSQPIGRDRLGHNYWLTQDDDCNLRIYQEHLDEEIWQVVATNRDEFVNLISRLRGNEVVLPSTDIGVIDEDTSSSNSCNGPIEKPPPPEEKDDSQEDDEAKVVPNLRLKLGEGGAYHHNVEKNVGKGEEELAAEEDKKLAQKKLHQQTSVVKKKITVVEEEEEEEAEVEGEEEDDIPGEEMEEEEEEEGEEAEEEDEEEVDSAEEDQSGDEIEENDSEAVVETEKKKSIYSTVTPAEETQKKVKPLLISQAKIASSVAVQHALPTNGCSKKRPLDDVDKTSPRPSDEHNSNTIKKFRPSLLDSKRDKKPSKYGKAKSDDEDDEDDDEDDEEDDEDVGSEEEDEADIEDEEGEEEDIDSAAAEEDENEEKDIEEDDEDDDVYDDNNIVGEVIEDPPIIVRGEGSGKQCDGANPEFLREFLQLDDGSIFLAQEEEEPEPIVGEAIEEEFLYIIGEGNGVECLVGNKNNEETTPSTPPASTLSTPTTQTDTSEPKATFFFGEPGCLKLSPIKKTASKEGEEMLQNSLPEASAANKKQQGEELLIAEKEEKIKKIKNSDKNEENNKDKSNEQEIVIEKENYENNDENALQEKSKETICEQINNENNDEQIQEISNDQKVEKVDANEINEINENRNVCDEKDRKENAKYNEQSKIEENNISKENETNPKEFNKSNEQLLDEPKETDISVATPELNGVSSSEQCNKNEEEKDLYEPPLLSDIERTEENSNDKTTLEETKETHENNGNHKELHEQAANEEAVQQNALKNENLVPKKEEEPMNKALVNEEVIQTAVEAEIVLEEKEAIPPTEFTPQTENLTKLSETVSQIHPETSTSTPTSTQTHVITQKCALPEKAEKGDRTTAAEAETATATVATAIVATATVATTEAATTEATTETAETIATAETAPTAIIETATTKARVAVKTRAVTETKEPIETTSAIVTTATSLTKILATSATVETLTTAKTPTIEAIETKEQIETIAKPSTTAAETTAPLQINRKRRLTDFAETQKPKMRPHTTSESEVELPEEPINLATHDDHEDDGSRIGGKRIKMRAKLTNTEIRKKVEAQKIAAVEETTSSSGEEEALRKRKIISPKQQLLNEKSSNFDLPQKLEKEHLQSQLAEIKEEVTVPTVVSAPPAPVVKQKPTLAEIIEKKLKKTPEKPVVKNEPCEGLNSISGEVTVVNASSISPQAPIRKSPITKPLKKNLLTQLRQEESDEEAIPRKRIIGKTALENVEQRQDSTQPASLALQTIEKLQKPEEPQKIEPLARATPDRATPDRQRKRRSSEDAQHSELTENAPKTDCLGEKLKKNDAHEVAATVKELSEEEVLPPPIKRLESTQEEISPSTTPSKIFSMKIPHKEEAVETKVSIIGDIKSEVKGEEVVVGNLSGRRSGRRGGTAVIYAELPQPKRTRGGSKAATVVVSPPKQEIVKPKVESVKTKPKEETLPDIKKPEDEPEIKKATEVQIESKEVKTIAQDKDIAPAIVKSPQSPPEVKPAKTPPKARGRKKREVDTTNIIEATDSETPVRQSRRIAQQKIREEAERRKLEEIALRTMKNELKKKKKAAAQADPTVPEPSEQSSSPDDTDVSEIEAETKKLKKKKCPGKDGTWSSGSEEQEEPEEEEEPPHYESDPGSPLFKSDHEFSPESDLEDESQVVPMKRARTARKEDAELSDAKHLDQEEEACQKCGKSDHPEWILLCDNCDKGYHCSCLSPVLFYIPEGDWYCPPCQQEQLIAALEKQLVEFDLVVKQKRLEEEEAQRLAEAEAERVEVERLEAEKRKKKKKKQRGDGESSDNDAEENGSAVGKSDKDSDDEDDDENAGEKSVKNKEKKAKKNQSNEKRKQRREVGGHRRRRRRAATRGARQRRRNASKSGGSGDSDDSDGSGSQSGTDSKSKSSGGSNSSSSATDSDDEPIYKLRKRRQINVSYRLNEYDDLINSALRKEMDEAAMAGNLGRGKDISTIIEADKEEQARQKQLEDGDGDEFIDAITNIAETDSKTSDNKIAEVADVTSAEATTKACEGEKKTQEIDSEEEPLKRKAKVKQTLKKKPRKLTTLDISSEEDNASDEDFKGSSLDEDDEDTSVSLSSNSDSSLEIYKRRGKKGNKKTRKAARRTARERRKVRKFVVDDSDEDEEEETRPKSKKKRKTDSDYTESEESGELSELSENMDSADLCDDTSSSEDSDGAWHPSKRKKQRKSNVANVARKSPKLKKPQTKKPKRVEYSDDDVSEEEEEDYEDEDDDLGMGGKGSGKQPRSVPLKTSNAGKGKGKGKGGAGAGKSSKVAAASKKKKKKLSDYDDDSFSDSEDSTRRTRGRRYAYLEDFEDDSSDGGIKPGVKRPDTPPEEREKFIKKQEEIKRMLAEKNAEGAKLAATPRLTPIKGGTRSPAKPGDSLSTVPLSVIRQAKVLDIDYLQRKGESVSDMDNVDDVDSEFDDADLPDDFPEDMDEDAIARMVEEEEEFGAAAASRELPAPDEVLKPVGTKVKAKEPEKVQVPSTANPSLAALSQMPSNAGSGSHSTGFTSGLQEPMRKRLPMPTMHPPLLRHQYPGSGQHHHSLPPHMMQRHAGPPTHLLQNALSAPLGQSIHRNFPQQSMVGAQRGPPGGPSMPPRHALPPHALPPSQQQLSASQPLPVSPGDSEAKPRGRRKKITPLRDPLQKQQAAAAATAAATGHPTTTTAGNASNKPETRPVTSVAPGVIKTATSLAIAQPPQLYKQPTGGSSNSSNSSSSSTQPSVITRMPHLPPHSAPPGRGMPLGPPGMYASGDVARFYGPPMQQASSQPGSRLPPTSSQRHRGPPHVGGMPPHHGMRPSYGPPPPLRGVIGSTNQTPPNSVSGTRPPYPPPPNHGDHHGAQAAGPYGPPPPARHAAPHINPYRPSIFGNPNYGPRGAPPGANMRTSGPPSQEYTAGPPRSYAPYGYYPPPPPLTAAHQPPPTSTHPAPSSSHAPVTSKSSAVTARTSTPNTSTPQPPAVPSSVIVSAPPSSIQLTPNNTSAAQQKQAVPRVVIKTAPATVGPQSKSTPDVPATVSPSTSAIVEPRKKLITLETFATSKSPLALSGESSGSRSSPNVQPDGADDSTSAPAAAASGGNGQGASEFSGLVSYFSSQHDDYNT